MEFQLSEVCLAYTGWCESTRNRYRVRYSAQTFCFSYRESTIPWNSGKYLMQKGGSHGLSSHFPRWQVISLFGAGAARFVVGAPGIWTPRSGPDSAGVHRDCEGQSPQLGQAAAEAVPQPPQSIPEVP